MMRKRRIVETATAKFTNVRIFLHGSSKRILPVIDLMSEELNFTCRESKRLNKEWIWLQ
jgi:hypothetical protein